MHPGMKGRMVRCSRTLLAAELNTSTEAAVVNIMSNLITVHFVSCTEMNEGLCMNKWYVLWTKLESLDDVDCEGCCKRLE
jgi:hypothetical protein